MNLLVNAIPLLSPFSGVGNYVYELSRAINLVSPETIVTYFYGAKFSRTLRNEPNLTFVRAKEFVKKNVCYLQSFG